MTDIKHLIEQFYNIVWNEKNEEVARDILSSDFRFRGSLGTEKLGVQGFIEYVHSIHEALADYKCIIEELVISEHKAAARMKFCGRHQASFLDVPPTGKQIEWSGAAFFEVENSKITSLWVLGDVDSIKRQLRIYDNGYHNG